MYFAILGRHPKLSLAEFALISTKSVQRKGAYLLFDTELSQDALLEQLQKLGGIVKWGKVVLQERLSVAHELGETKNEVVASFLAGVTIVGVNNQKLGMEIKKLYGVRRFKVVELTSSDLEIKKDGKELILLGGGQIGLVLGRQDIAHFELIDFGKPASGMEVGMMPAKLAQILVNIGVTQVQQAESKALTVYDPFCGFGTTGFVANRVGNHFVGSDVNITGAKDNAKWRKKLPDALPHQAEIKPLHTIFVHDVVQPFVHPVVQKVDLIVTEGWLGPVIGKKTREPELRVHAQKIHALYNAFLTNISASIPDVPVVLTLPVYTRFPELIFPQIATCATRLGYQRTDIDVYMRKGQEVARQVIVLKRTKT